MRVKTPSWAPVVGDHLGFMNTLSGVFSKAEVKGSHVFPRLRDASCLFVASDYGGEHKSADWETITFLLTDMASAAAWQPGREQVRLRLLPDGRRMAFKNLNDRVRQRALDHFLGEAGGLDGLLVTFALARSMSSVFVDEGRLDPTVLGEEQLRDLSPSVAERLLRIVHLLSFLVAGFSAPGQDLLWATDEDSIAANSTRVQHLVATLARVASHYLPHDLRHLRVATAKQDKGDMSLEDLLSIPDIASGGLSAALTAMVGSRGAPKAGLLLPAPEAISVKTRRVMNWLSDGTQPLRRLVVLINEEPHSHRLRATRLRLIGSREAGGLL